MAKTITITLTDDQEQTLTWMINRVNQQRAQVVHPGIDQPKPLTVDDGFRMFLDNLFAANRQDFDAWKLQRRAAAIDKLGPAARAALDAQLGVTD